MVSYGRTGGSGWIDFSMSGNFPVAVVYSAHKFNAENSCMCQSPFVLCVLCNPIGLMEQ